MTIAQLPPANDPSVVGAGLTRPQIEAYAERLTEHHQIFADGSSADLKGLLRTLGGQLEIGDTEESLIVRGKGDFTIYLPALTSWRRDRFTIAHELGHYFLHYRFFKIDEQEMPKRRYKRYGRSIAETEANYFAAALLMPKPRFFAEYEESSGDLYQVADAFEVSSAAAGVRAQSLHLA